jgi:regulator of replication initiation timing
VQALEEENAALRREVQKLRAALAGRQAQDGGAERSAAPEGDAAVREKAAREVAMAFAQAHGAGHCPFGFDKLSRVADERARAHALDGECSESTVNAGAS